jgi:hypothetical protein
VEPDREAKGQGNAAQAILENVVFHGSLA